MKYLILVGQTPPPYHGQAIATGFVFEHLWEGYDVTRIRLEYSTETNNVGKFAFSKMFHLITVSIRTIKAAAFKKNVVLYYPPGGPWTVPLCRDIIYLCFVRLFIRRAVFHFHAGGLPDFLETKGLLGKLGRFAYGKPEVTISLYPKEENEGSYFCSENHVTVPNGVDVPEINKIKTEKFRILYLGLLEKEKGILEFLKTILILLNKGLKVEGQLVGGWYDEGIRAEALEFVKTHKMSKSISFAGIKKDREKWKEYAAADLFFFPSYYSNENFPLVLIEALGFGLPIVTTSWRGIPNLMGEEGFVLPIKEVDSYAEKIEQVILDPILYKNKSEGARRLYEEKYSLQQFVNNVEKAVEKAYPKN